MGWRKQPADAATLDAVERMCGAVIKHALPRGVFARYSYKDFCLAEAEYELKGNDIAKHLSGAKYVVIMAVTLGLDIDRESARLQRVSVRDALIFDAAASAAIEAFADEFTERMSNELGLPVGMRFSPGYGDFPIEAVSDIASLLHADKRIGLTVTGSHGMIPLKSITAVAPVNAGCDGKRKNCAACLKTDCAFRSEKQ